MGNYNGSKITINTATTTTTTIRLDVNPGYKLESDMKFIYLIISFFFSLTMANIQQISLPPLDWKYNELEPYISGEINEIHYTKHHRAYVDGYNNATQAIAAAEAEGRLEDVHSQQQNVKFFSGGHINHSLFWKNLSPNSVYGGKLPENGSPLYNQVIEQYGSFDKLISVINQKLASIQGSGWVFLAKNINGNTLDVLTTANQDTITLPYVALIAIDAWEHAYYLQYQNVKADYFKAIWNVINWKEAEARYQDKREGRL